jgi:inner membrane protein
MYKTHFLFSIFLALIFLSYANNKLLFFLVILVSTFLPDIDCVHSLLGKQRILRPLQWFVKHRGVFHSLTFCLIICLLLALYYPALALPFFLGYAGHLFLDSFTERGIKPFWPLKKELKGVIKSNGNIERGIFYFFILANILLIIKRII